MTTDSEQEIAGLRAQIAEAESRIAKLEAKSVKKIPQPPPLERGVTITEVQALVACALPDVKQLQELANIVLVQFLNLAPSYPHGTPSWQRADIAHRWHKGFSAAFTALGAMRRLEKPDHSHYPSHFVDHAASWLRSHGVCTDIGETFFAACLAFGNVPWVDPRVDGQVLELGLNAYIGKPANAKAWQRVLETGQLLPPTAPALRMAPRSPTRVIYG